MKVFVLISAIIELLAGVVFFLAPQLVPGLAEGPEGYLPMGRMYGAIALGLGVFALQVWRNADQPLLLKIFLSSYLVFHLCVCIAFAGAFLAGVFPDPAAAILHLTMALITAYFFFKHNLAESPMNRKVLIGGGIVVGVLVILFTQLPQLLA